MQVWDGGDLIAEKVKDDQDWCDRYAESMKTRFPWCTVTNEPISGVVTLP